MQTVGTATKIVEGISKEEIFLFWSDVHNWARWNDGIDKAELSGEFKAGNFFRLFLKNGQKVKIKLLKVEKNQNFTDLTNFPFAKMHGNAKLNSF